MHPDNASVGIITLCNLQRMSISLQNCSKSVGSHCSRCHNPQKASLLEVPGWPCAQLGAVLRDHAQVNELKEELDTKNAASSLGHS